jgi:transcriptional regulator, TetR family
VVVTSPAPGLRERKKLATRRAIRRAALALFKSQGYAATTVEQIAQAQAADVAPMTVYRYFGTKEATVVSVSLTPALREGLGRMADALASDGAPTVAEVSGLVALLAAEEEDWLESLAVRGELVASTPELEQALWAQSSAWTTTLAEQLPTEASARVQARALAGACLEGLLAWRDRSAFPDADSLVGVIQEALNAIRVPTSIPAP